MKKAPRLYIRSLDYGRHGVASKNHPKGPSSYIVDTWALKGFLYPYFVAYVSTIWLLGPFGTMDHEPSG